MSVPDDLSEPVRNLHANIQFERLDHPVKSILVTSAVKEEGKSMLVRNLGLVYAEWGASVVIVEVDLRRPTLADSFETMPLPGLTEVLRGHYTLEEALQTVIVKSEAPLTRAPLIEQLDGNSRPDGRSPYASPVEGAQVGSNPGPERHFPSLEAMKHERQASPSHGSPAPVHLSVLVSGFEPANPQAVLGSQRMRDVLTRLHDVFDVVLLDSPPLLAVSDALPLLSAVDGILVVTRLGSTPATAGRALVNQLGRVQGAEVLGVVVNDVKRSAFGSPVYYGYSSGS
jgi:Mrp family chromosome partitioning ATPase